MSHSSRKRGEPQVVRDLAQFGDAFRRQYRLLVSLGAAFDAGDHDAAYPLSTVLRTLLDGALLNRVIKLKLLRLVNSADVPEGNAFALGFGLTRMRFAAGEVTSGEVVPAFHASPAVTNPDVVFREWWARDLAIFTLNVAVTREYLVLEMANTDGGAHVDSSVDANYLHLLSQDAAFQFYGRPTKGTVATASVRQIAWELQRTLELKHADLLS